MHRVPSPDAVFEPTFIEGGDAPSRPPLPPGPYLVVGLGRAGIAAAGALAAIRGAGAVRVWDAAADAAQRSRAATLRGQGVDVRLGGDGGEALDGIATIVKSPGVPPETAVVAEALRRGLPVHDEFEIGRRLVPAPLVGVTGTKGKSTVSALLMAVLAAHGLDPRLCGNTEFGTAITELVGGPPPGSLVAELSSFQLEFSRELIADAAVFTKLAGEHLVRHRTMDAYIEAKRNLFIQGDRAVALAALNVDDAIGARLAREVEERGGRAVRFGESPDADYRILDSRWDLREAWLKLAAPSGEVIVETRLPGLHNARNVAAVLAVADQVGLPREPTLAAMATAAAPPGRFQVIDVDRPFDVIVDLGATPASITTALDTSRAVAWARGGRLIAVVGFLGNSAIENGRTSGALARPRCDHLILSGTSYRGEPRIPALVELAAGARSVAGGPLELVIDRRAAIARGVELAGPGDVLVLAGRGSYDKEATDARGGYIELHDGQVARELAAELT